MRANEKGTRTPIDRWETLEVLHTATRPCRQDRQGPPDDLGVVVEVQRPIFEGGRAGRPSMGVVIRRGERLLRLFCRDGDTAEISDLRDMLGALDAPELERLAVRFSELRSEYDPHSVYERSSPRGPSLAPSFWGQDGTGWPPSDKPDRRRRKHSRDRND